jgi:TolB protein
MKYVVAVILLSILNSSSIQAQKGLISYVRDSYPAISPDGKWVVFHSNRSGKQAIYIMDTAGKNLKQLTDFGWSEGTAKWSPDGNRMVFSADPEPDNSEIFIINKDGSGLKRLTHTKGDDSHPAWSGDGKKIIFNSARTSPDLSLPWNRQYHEIFEMNADGTGIRQITTNKTTCTYPAYSPDGKKIVYRKVTNEPGYNWDFSPSLRNSEVFVSDINGANEINISKNAAFDGWPTWSPDGQWILFGSNRAGPANVGSLFIIKPDGTGLQRITQGPMGYAQPAWSPDGKWIYAYMNSEDEEREYGFIQKIPFPIGSN